MNADKTIVDFITIQSQNTILNVFVMNTKEARVQANLKMATTCCYCRTDSSMK